MDLRARAPAVREEPGLGAGQSRGDLADAGGCGRTQHLPARLDPQRLLPRAGYGRPDGRPACRPEHLLPGHAEEAHPDRQHNPQGSGGGDGRRLHRRPACRRRLHAGDPETAQQARSGARRGQPSASQACPRHRRLGLPGPGAGHAGRRPPGQQHLPIYAEGGRSRRVARVGHEASAGLEACARAYRRRYRSGRRWCRSLCEYRSRYRQPARHHAVDDRQRALRRLRPAPGLDHLFGPQPISCGDGRRARIHRIARGAPQYLCPGDQDDRR